MSTSVKRYKPGHRSILFIGLIISCASVCCQLTRPGNPFPLYYEGSKELMIYEFEVAEQIKSKALKEEIHPWLKPEKTGFSIDVDFDIYETGVWDTLKDGTKLWRAGFLVRGATAINIVFNSYRVYKGVAVFLFDPDQQSVLGAFTDLNNKSIGMLATAQIFAEIVVVEVQVPAYLESAGQLAVAQIGCDFAASGDFTGLKDGWFGLSGYCNEDINCYSDPEYQKIKYSVIRIVYSGGERCTGTLINNTLQNGRNYVLTAGHCINSEENANTSVFYFNYESPYCSGPDGNSMLSASGATIRAKGDELDFVLMELLEPVPFYYHPYYAGWDITDNQPLSGITIHHPRGDVKKISIENHSLTEATFSSEFIPLSHWLVHHWESGTTEAGSSGGAFFDQNNRIVGTLTGGQAQCGSPFYDYFQKIGKSWDYYPENNRQLNYWLDPVNLNPSFMDGFDPYQEFWETGDTLNNIEEDEQLVAEKNGLAWGYLSGHNSDYITRFAEQFGIDGNKTLFGVLLDVARNFVASVSAHMIIKVWRGGGLPEELIYEKNIPLADLVQNNINLVELDSIVPVSDTFYVGYELFYENPMDTFAVKMADNRTIQQEHTAYIFDGVNWMSLADYTSGSVYTSFAIMPVVYEQTPDINPDGRYNGNVLVYPNPVSDIVWIEFKEMSASEVKLQLYSLSGQLIFQQDFPPYQTLIHLNTASLTPGVYILRITRDRGASNIKLVIFK